MCAKFCAAVFKDGAEFDFAKFHVPACFHKTTWYEATTFLQCQFPLQRRLNIKEDSVSEEDIINFSHAQIFGAVEFNQSLRPSDVDADVKLYDYGEVSDECILANFQYIHIHGQRWLRLFGQSLPIYKWRLAV